jgi:hypothetical protein
MDRDGGRTNRIALMFLTASFVFEATTIVACASVETLPRRPTKNKPSYLFSRRLHSIRWLAKYFRTQAAPFRRLRRLLLKTDCFVFYYDKLPSNECKK